MASRDEWLIFSLYESLLFGTHDVGGSGAVQVFQDVGRGVELMTEGELGGGLHRNEQTFLRIFSSFLVTCTALGLSGCFKMLRMWDLMMLSVAPGLGAVEGWFGCELHLSMMLISI